MGLQTRRVYHSLFRAQASSCLPFACSAPKIKLKAIKKHTHALTSFGILSNIRPVFWGSGVMIRTSRCFAVNSFQLGGSDTLVSVGRSHGNLPFVDFLVRTLPTLFRYEFFCSFF